MTPRRRAGPEAASLRARNGRPAALAAREIATAAGAGPWPPSIRRLGEGGTWRSSSRSSSRAPSASSSACTRAPRATTRSGCGRSSSSRRDARPAIVRPGASAPPPRPSASPISRSVHRASRWSAGRVPRAIRARRPRSRSGPSGRMRVRTIEASSSCPRRRATQTSTSKTTKSSRRRTNRKRERERVRRRRPRAFESTTSRARSAATSARCARGVRDARARRAPTRQPAGTRPRGRGRGWGRGRAGARPATRVLSVPLRDRRVPNTSRANEPSNSETTLVRGDSRSIVSSSRTNVAERAGAGRVVHDVGVRMTRRARGVH